jgi:hypothetical protein
VKITIQKVTTIDVEIELEDFIKSRACELEFIDLNVHPSYSSWDGYPDKNFIMIYQHYDMGEWVMSEVACLVCETKPEDMTAYVLEHIDEIIQLEH